MPQIMKRMLRAALLDADAYEEVEADKGANGQALLVVVLAAVATGVGSIENSGVSGILWQTLVAVGGWYVWAYVTYFIGVRFLPTQDTVADRIVGDAPEARACDGAGEGAEQLRAAAETGQQDHGGAVSCDGEMDLAPVATRRAQRSLPGSLMLLGGSDPAA